MDSVFIVEQLEIMNKKLEIANLIELYKLGFISEYSLKYRAGLNLDE